MGLHPHSSSNRWSVPLLYTYHAWLPPQTPLTNSRGAAGRPVMHRTRTRDQAGRLQADAHEGQHMGVVHIRHQLGFPLKLPQLPITQLRRGLLLSCCATLAAAQKQLLDSKGRAFVVCQPHLEEGREGCA